METYGHSLTEMEAHVAAVKVCVCVCVDAKTMHFALDKASYNGG